MLRYHRSMRRRRRSMRRSLRSRGVTGDCGAGITPDMCNRVTNHGDMSTFSKPAWWWWWSAELIQLRNRRKLRTDIAASPVTPRDRRHLRIERRYDDIVASDDKCFMMFHNVLSVSWCFTCGSRCLRMYHNVLHVFHDVLLCLTMFYDV